MIITMILIFVFGYLCIALEHKLRIDKAAIALLMCGALWTVLSLLGNDAQIGTQLIEQLGDTSEILFFLGILMSVAALQSAGLLTDFADFLDKNVHEVYTIAGITGLLSAVIDNVPLVAACMGMYPVVDTAALASSLDPVYMQAFVQDGIFWHLLTFCAAGIGRVFRGHAGYFPRTFAAGLKSITTKKGLSNKFQTALFYLYCLFESFSEYAILKGLKNLLDSLFYFFLPLLPGQDSASANFGHELLTINDIADVNPLADHPFGIAGPDIEGELTPFDFGQHGGCDDFGTDARRLDMGHVHLGTDGRRTFRQMVSHSLHRRIFHQGHHSRRSEYLQVARSHRCSHVAAIDRYLTLCRKSFFHHNTTVFYCVNNSESLSLNIALDRRRLGKPGTSPVFARLSLSLAEDRIRFGNFREQVLTIALTFHYL